MIVKLLMWVFLSLAAWEDYHKKSISLWLYIVFGITGFAVRYIRSGQWSGWDLVTSLLVGVITLWICVWSKGGIGEGDGWFFIVSAFYLPWNANWLLFLGGILMSVFYGFFLLLVYPGQYWKIRKRTVAFLPFLLLPGLWVICL